MPWIDEDQGFDYRFLKSGGLEFQDRRGRYRLSYGCTAAGLFELQERQEELLELLGAAPESATIEELYHLHPRFRYVCDRVLELNGVEADWVSPRIARLLLFAAKVDGQIVQAPLTVLNRPPERKYPATPGGQPISDKAMFLAVLVSHCGGDIKAAYEVATSAPAREVLALLEERGWAALSDEEKGKARMEAERVRLDAQFGDLRRKIASGMMGGGNG